MSNPKVGIAIAAHNAEKIIGRCLSGLIDGQYTVVLFDDASIDRTIDIAQSMISNIVILNGDGSAWWGGGTAQAVDKCFSMGCDFVLMLNPDSIVTDGDIKRLVEYASKSSNIIAAGIVVRDNDKNNIFWGGSRRLKIPGLPVYYNKYIYRKNTSISGISMVPYKTDEVHGRGVLVSRSVYNSIGTLDWKRFPHYGADNDYSLRALSAGISLVILPDVKVRLAVDNSGMKMHSKAMSLSRFIELYYYLTKRKNGDYIRVLWRLSCRHTGWIAVIPTFLFNMLYVIYRKLL